MRYWLMKSEPEAYGIDDLARDKVTAWWGVRNYQARNFMRDQMQPGDRGFFYHSNCAEPGIVVIVEGRSDRRYFARLKQALPQGSAVRVARREALPAILHEVGLGRVGAGVDDG